MSINQEQLNKVQNAPGFIAALDQSGGSTPKALAAYGVSEDQYSGEDAMYDAVHAMRTRIIKSPVFNGEHILGAILFEKTMDNSIDGKPTSTYLWEELGVIPFLKIDKGLADEANGVQMMKKIPDSEFLALMKKALNNGIFGTKMRSVINSNNELGIKNIVAQQFEVGKQILAHNLIPIIEPEISIGNADKAECEATMKAEILKQLDALEGDKPVMLKLTLPEEANFYAELINHPKVARVVALSGGYDLEEACTRLASNEGMIASFSRALANDLRFNQSDEEFDSKLGDAIDQIYRASVLGLQTEEAA